MESENQKDKSHNSWPGKTPLPESQTGANDSAKLHWHPTDFGPGMGPDLSASGKKSEAQKKKPNRETTDERESESCSIVHAAEGILKFQIGDQCPNCDFAKLKLDADDHISCPICGFGSRRSCG